MQYNVYKDKLRSLSSKFNLMVVLVLGLLITNVLTASLSWYAMLHQKERITPFFGGSGYVSSASKVDAAYLNLMAENFVYARLNVTPNTVVHHHTLLLRFADSAIYSNLAALLKKESKVVKARKLSSVFDITGIKSNPNTLTSIVSGELRRWVGLRALKTEKARYRLTFTYRLGRLHITTFTRVKGEGHA